VKVFYAVELRHFMSFNCNIATHVVDSKLRTLHILFILKAVLNLFLQRSEHSGGPAECVLPAEEHIVGAVNVKAKGQRQVWRFSVSSRSTPAAKTR
jgi:hypothetical protein